LQPSAPWPATSSRKWRARQPLALQPALHVADAEQDGVDGAALDLGAQLVELHGAKLS
jgi:hypothetical protein